MPIPVRCVCNKVFDAADKLAGKSINCPSCKMVISVPDQDELNEANSGHDDPYYDPSNKKRKPVANPNDHGGFFSFEKKILSGGAIGGLLAMVGAIAWFVLGMMANRFFIYPPVLFVVGLVAFIRALQSDD